MPIEFDPQSLDNWAGRITAGQENLQRTIDAHTEQLRKQNGNYAEACKRLEKMEAWRVIHANAHAEKEEKAADRLRRRNRWMMIIIVTFLTFFLSVAALALDQYLI